MENLAFGGRIWGVLVAGKVSREKLVLSDGGTVGRRWAVQVLAAWRGADCAWRAKNVVFVPLSDCPFCYVCLAAQPVFAGRFWLGKGVSDQSECAGRERPTKKERGGELAAGLRLVAPRIGTAFVLWAIYRMVRYCCETLQAL